MVAVGIVWFWPYFDDSRFVNACRKLEGGTLGSVIDLCESRGRNIIIHRTPRGDFIGLRVEAADGFVVEFAVDPVSFKKRPSSGWRLAMIRNLTIQSTGVYDLRYCETFSDEEFRAMFK